MHRHSTPLWKAASVLTVMAMLVLTGLSATPARVVLAANTGWLSPAADVADTGGDDDGFERTPADAYIDDVASNRAAESRNTCVDVACTERHLFYNYGITLPADAVVQGIEVRADWWLDSAQGTNWLGVDLSWDGGTTWTSLQTDMIELTTQHTRVFGGTGDTWGRTWSADEFSDENFRVRVNIFTDAANTRDFFLDWIPVRVTYNQPPAIPTNQTPVDGAFVAAANPTFTWSAFSDPNVGDLQSFFRVQLRTEMGAYGDADSHDSGSVAGTANTYTPAAWNLDTGTYCWHVCVRDNSGATNAWSDYSSETCFTIERTAPTSTASSPAYDNQGTIPVDWTASEEMGGSGVDTVALWYRLEAGGWTDSGLSQSGEMGTFDFDPPGGTEGTYYFQTIATDMAGNVEAGPDGDGDDSTVYDTTPPTSQAAPPAGPINAETIPVPWTADGAVSGIAMDGTLLRYNYNGGAFTDGPTASGMAGTFNFDPMDGDGTYCFYTIATDNAGNVEAAPAGMNGDGCTDFVFAAAPTAMDDNYSTPQDTPLTVDAPGVLDNDTDPDDDPLTALLFDGPAMGTLDLETDGSFLYTPAAGFNGMVTFTYYATDGTTNSNVATVTIMVGAGGMFDVYLPEVLIGASAP